MVIGLDATAGLRAGVLVVMILCVGAMVTVARLYGRAYRRAPRGGGLTPLHVLLVSVSTLGLQTTLAWALMEGITAGAPASPATLIRTGLYGLWSAGILVALVVVGRQQKKRLDQVGSS